MYEPEVWESPEWEDDPEWGIETRRKENLFAQFD